MYPDGISAKCFSLVPELVKHDSDYDGDCGINDNASPKQEDWRTLVSFVLLRFTLALETNEQTFFHVCSIHVRMERFSPKKGQAYLRRTLTQRQVADSGTSSLIGSQCDTAVSRRYVYRTVGCEQFVHLSQSCAPRHLCAVCKATISCLSVFFFLFRMNFTTLQARIPAFHPNFLRCFTRGRQKKGCNLSNLCVSAL